MELQDERDRLKLRRDHPGAAVTVGEYAADVLARMADGRLRTKGGRRFKGSTLGTVRQKLTALTAVLATRRSRA